MSRPLGGYIGHRPVPATAGLNSAAGGMWTLREAETLTRVGTWPRAGVPSPGYVTAISVAGDQGANWDQDPPNQAAVGTVAKITDGNAATGGGTNGLATEIRIDMGQVRSINGVYVRGLQIPGYWNSSYAAGRQIQTSTNGADWTAYATSGTASELNSLQLYQSGTVAVRYIRLYQAAPDFMGVSEFYPSG